MTIILAVFLLAVLWVLKYHAIPAIAGSKIAEIDITKIFKLGKGRSP
jgi:hypothetical protein